MTRLTGTTEGTLWMMGAVVFFTVMTVSIRFLVGSIPEVEQIFFRSVIVIVVLAPWLARARFKALRTNNIGLSVARAVFIGIGTLTWFIAVGRIPLAEAVALHFTLPLFGILLAIGFLGEKVGKHRWIATIVGFGGTLVILRPGFVEVDPITLIVLLSAATYAAGAIMGKKLLDTDAPITVVFYTNFLIGGFAAIPTALDWVTPSAADLPAILAIGISAAAAHSCIAHAFAAADASFILTLEFTRLPVTAVAAYYLFAEVPDVWTVAGAAIIFATVWYVNRAELDHGAAGG
jgi:drug/metabolite transporter (DMT)-like permease